MSTLLAALLCLLHSTSGLQAPADSAPKKEVVVSYFYNASSGNEDLFRIVRSGNHIVIYEGDYIGDGCIDEIGRIEIVWMQRNEVRYYGRYQIQFDGSIRGEYYYTRWNGCIEKHSSSGHYIPKPKK